MVRDGKTEVSEGVVQKKLLHRELRGYNMPRHLIPNNVVKYNSLNFTQTVSNLKGNLLC